MAQSARAPALDEKPSRLGLQVTAAAGWLMLLPATAFLAAAALRLLQPRRFQPAHTAWIISEWAASHLSHLAAAGVFLGLPGMVLIVGGGSLWVEWARDQALRQDAANAVAILRQQLGAFCLAAAVLLAGGILTVVITHLIVG